MTRRKTILWLALLPVVILSLASCNDKDGDWDPIKMSKKKVVFSQEGGSTIIQCKNYPAWWICSLRDAVSGESIIPQAPQEVESEGIHISLPQEDQVEIRVDASEAFHHWKLGMQAGDAFASIDILQNDEGATLE